MKKALDQVFQTVSTQLGVVSKYYGVVRTVNTASYGTFPVACAATLSCDTPDSLYAATPNSKETGIAYVETQGITMRLPANLQNIVEYQLSARYVVWYNAGKLGFSPCEGQDKLILKAMKCASERRKVEIQPGVWAEVELNLASTSFDTSEIFRPYKYSDRAHLLAFPYEAFAINYTVRVLVPALCLDFSLPSPINCVTV